ncbi:MAG: hypothetical protein LUB61_05535 [Eggerthellaceae bacterium]|nr:hypothetical protein [Eggerthellaceae bacterium]
MSQRNPLNERYTTDSHKGVTRKSAASAKPKTQAASSVVIASTKKDPKQKKAEEKAQRKKEQEAQREIDRKYYTPDTPEYKRLRRMWWMCLGGAAVCVVISYFSQLILPSEVAFIFLIGAYALIIYAFYIDFSKIKKVRKAYQAEMLAKEAQEAKQKKAEERIAAAKAAHKGRNRHKTTTNKTKDTTPVIEAEPVEMPKAKSGILSNLFGTGFRLQHHDKSADKEPNKS